MKTVMIICIVLGIIVGFANIFFSIPFFLLALCFKGGSSNEKQSN